VVPSLKTCAKQGGITKLAVIGDSPEKEKIKKLFEPFEDSLSLNFSTHPITETTQFGLISKKGISKKQGAIELSSLLNIPLENMLGMGDGLMDLEFMRVCGFCGTLAQADESVKKFVEGRGVCGFVGPSVDENGMLDVLAYFFKK
jgi:hydroxymethylpyrimidine pyrophosphatase-like HAD family hydrolase